MTSSNDDYSILLKDIHGDKYDELVLNKIKEFNGLIDTEAAIRVLAYENKLIKKKFYKLSEACNAKHGALNVIAQFVKEYPVFEYNGANKSFKVQRILLKDDSGETTLSFWNDKILDLKNIILFDKIKFENLYSNNDELNYGDYSKMEVMESCTLNDINELNNGLNTVQGKVVEVFPEYNYERNGQKHVMGSLKLMNGANSVRIILWAGLEMYRLIKEGDTVRFENVLFRNAELNFNSSSRIVIIKSFRKSSRGGKLQDIIVTGGKVELLINDNKYNLTREKLLTLLGIEGISEDITLNTLLELKKSNIIDRDVILIDNDSGKIESVEVV